MNICFQLSLLCYHRAFCEIITALFYQLFFSQCIDTVVLMTGRHPASDKPALVIPKVLFWGRGITWSNWKGRQIKQKLKLVFLVVVVV